MKKYLLESEPYEIKNDEIHFRYTGVTSGTTWTGGIVFTACKLNNRICNKQIKCTDCSVYQEKLYEQKHKSNTDEM